MGHEKKTENNDHDDNDYSADTEEILESLEIYLSVFEINPEDPAIIREILDILDQIENFCRPRDLDEPKLLVGALKTLLIRISEGGIVPNEQLTGLVLDAPDWLRKSIESCGTGKDKASVALIINEITLTIDAAAKNPNDNPGAGCKSSDEYTGESEKSEEEQQNLIFFCSAVEQQIVTIYECINELRPGFARDKFDSLVRALQGIKGASIYINHEEMLLMSENLENELLNIEKSEDKCSILMECLDNIENFADGILSFIEKTTRKNDNAGNGDIQKEGSSGSAEEESAGEKSRNGQMNRISLKSSNTVRLPVEKINNLMNSIEELLITSSKLKEIGRKMEKSGFKASHIKAIDNIYSHFEKTTELMYNETLSMRMSPVRSLFGKFKNVIRELSSGQNKKIKVIITGEETEVDRLALETLKDPLIHLIRNAVDHGIESPGEREKAGKSIEGVVNLRAFNDVNSVVIEIEDDGKGIDWRKIRDIAIEKGLCSAEEAVKKTPREILDFIMQPGFSTAKEITNISGRGVGMDVVKTSIQSMSGRIEIDTEPGRGSCFIIRLPLAMTMIEALLIRIGDEKYSIPVDAIEKIMKIPVDEFRSIYQHRVLPLKKRTLPYSRAMDILEVKFDSLGEKSYSRKKDDNLFTLIIGSNGNSAALGVDEILGKQKVVIKNLGGFLKSVPGISGASIQGDGSVALILDGFAMCEMARKTEV